jgi:putative ABC transport system substrate-binding protein
MDRRAFLAVAAAGGLFAMPAGARAQQTVKVYRIGLLALTSSPTSATEAFRQGLRKLGYVEGRDLIIEYRWATGKQERLPEQAAELVRLKVEVIVAVATPSVEAAKGATTTIPIVMTSSGDPVGSGLVTSLARPGGNVSGLSLLSTELVGKRLQMVRELLPKATRVAVLDVRGYASVTKPYLEQMRAAAQQMGVQLVVHEVTEAGDLPGAFTAMQRERAQALDVRASPFSTEHAKRIVELAAQHRLPVMYDGRSFVEAGGLLSYGPSIPDLFRRAAFYVDRVLKGTKPADLPIEQPTKFELVINMKAAKALGLTIPPALLARADHVIQ